VKKNENVTDVITKLIAKHLGDSRGEYLIPPPVFEFMQGEFIQFDPEAKLLTARFPVLESYLNPYKAVQGGIVAAAIDNTLGPLSVLIAPPNMTRTMDLTYSKPVTIDMMWITVHGRFIQQEGQRLTLFAEVRSPDGTRLARAKAVHWIINAKG